MKPLLTAAQIRQADAYTIENEPITSVDLTERAARAFTDAFTRRFADKERSISIYCGTGNNGGDGLAIAQLLHYMDYKHVRVKIARYAERSSDDFDINFERIKALGMPVAELQKQDTSPAEDSDILIDALLGTGLNKPLEGSYKQLVNHLNGLQKTVVAVDVPTGFFTEGQIDPDAVVLKANLVITFQQPKINFLLPESASVMAEWECVDIGLNKVFIGSLHSPYQLVEEGDILSVLQPRSRFTHKGTYGHALLITGQDKTMGAALLCSLASINAGAGLATVCVPQSGLTALNTHLPEAMAIVREGQQQPEIDWGQFSTIGIGPGLGKAASTLELFEMVLDNYRQPIVVDADALNLLAQNKELLHKLPEGSILTPHMKEFDRLFGDHANWWQRLQTGLEKAVAMKLNIVLKNDYTMIFTPDGKCYFNSTGNPAMATGGMGDVLTGVITGLLAQKYSPADACVAGVYLHGKAGDELALPHHLNVVLPHQVARRIPATMAGLIHKKTAVK